MTTPSKSPPGKFTEASERWCLGNLYQDLASAKGKALTRTEKEYLRGLLCGYSPSEIAGQCNVEPDTVRNYLSKGLYRYIEHLLLTQAAKTARVKSWSWVPQVLERAGYRDLHNQEKSSNGNNRPANGLPQMPLASSLSTQSEESWDCQPDISVFYNRVDELALLKQWALNDRCRSILLYGMGGIGKTSIAAKLAHNIKADFDCLIWRSLRNQPPIQSLLTDILNYLDCRSETHCLSAPSDQISQLMGYLHQHRCLLVLDDVQSVFCEGELAGRYQPGFESYGELLRRIEEESHQSCVVLTSWEKLRESSRLSGTAQSARSYRVEGLGEESKAILADAQLLDEDRWDDLIRPYRGNPLALRLISVTIQDLFGGSVAEFVDQKTLFLGDFKYLLHQQFKRLSEIEQAVMACLAAQTKPENLAEIKTKLATELPTSELMTVLNSLGRRSLIERSKRDSTTVFTLQPTVEKYVSTR